MEDLIQKVATTFGLEFELKEQQKVAISSVLSGKDTLVVLPTGFRKYLTIAAGL